MHHQHRQKCRRLLSRGIVLFSAPLAVAAAADYPFYFELELEQQHIPLEDNTRLEASSLGLSYREFLARGIGLELRLGRLGAEHETDGTPPTFDPSGYYAGLGFNSRTAERNRLQAGFDLEYSYYDSREALDAGTLEIDWTQGEARLWAALRLGNRFKLYGCVFALSVDGDQKLKGTASSRQTLNNREDSGRCAGIILETPASGVVGLEGSGGARRGGRIYFGKYFW